MAIYGPLLIGLKLMSLAVSFRKRTIQFLADITRPQAPLVFGQKSGPALARSAQLGTRVFSAESKCALRALSKVLFLCHFYTRFQGIPYFFMFQQPVAVVLKDRPVLHRPAEIFL